jgi:hypothetical protein
VARSEKGAVVSTIPDLPFAIRAPSAEPGAIGAICQFQFHEQADLRGLAKEFLAVRKPRRPPQWLRFAVHKIAWHAIRIIREPATFTPLSS